MQMLIFFLQIIDLLAIAIGIIFLLFFAPLLCHEGKESIELRVANFIQNMHNNNVNGHLLHNLDLKVKCKLA